MVHFGNDWDTILDGEFAKTYYQNLRQFLLTEYRTQTIYPGMYDIFNALKYTPAGGEIRIYKEEPLTLCIEDTGIGIAPEDLPRIFEKGYTGQNGRCDLRASGIGLYLCRRICKNLGVDIRAESHPEQGTVIRLNLSQKKFLLE